MMCVIQAMALKQGDRMDNRLSETQTFFNPEKNAREARELIMLVHAALKEKGYNPVNQIVGYILSGDPTYITSYNNARNLIAKLDRDELLEEIVTSYVNYTQNQIKPLK